LIYLSIISLPRQGEWGIFSESNRLYRWIDVKRTSHHYRDGWHVAGCWCCARL